MQVEQSTRSTNKSLKWLINEKQVPPEKIYESLCKQRVELVFTAHPTQVKGRGVGWGELAPVGWGWI